MTLGCITLNVCQKQGRRNLAKAKFSMTFLCLWDCQSLLVLHPQVQHDCRSTHLDISSGWAPTLVCFSRKGLGIKFNRGKLLDRRHYLKSWKHEVVVLNDFNQLHQFIDTKMIHKRLSSQQAVELKWSRLTTSNSITLLMPRHVFLKWLRATVLIDQRPWPASSFSGLRLSGMLPRVSSHSINFPTSLPLTKSAFSGLMLPPGSLCSPYVSPNLRQGWYTIRSNLTAEGSYVASVGDMTLKTGRIARRGHAEY